MLLSVAVLLGITGASSDLHDNDAMESGSMLPEVHQASARGLSSRTMPLPYDDEPRQGTLWAWDARSGSWAANDGAILSRAGAIEGLAGEPTEKGAVRGSSSWAQWLASSLGVHFSEDGSQEEPEQCESCAHPSQPQRGPPEPLEPQHRDRVPLHPGGFAGIDPAATLAKDGVTHANPASCASWGVSVGEDGVLYFLGGNPGTRNQTVLIRACRPKNSTWIFQKVRMPRRSPGVVSCGAVNGGALLGKDVVFCSDNDGNMLQWLPGEDLIDEDIIAGDAHQSASDRSQHGEPDDRLPTGHFTGLWLAITPPPSEMASWQDLKGLVRSPAEIRSAWQQAATMWGVGAGKWHMSEDSSVSSPD